MRVWLRLSMALVAAAGAAVPVQATWLEARSRHFILYADTQEARLREKALALERLDQMLRRFMKLDDPADSASNRLTVFVTGDADIRDLCRCQNVAGFYQPRVGGSVAFSGQMRAAGTRDTGQVVLFHEYAHHMLLGSYDLALPSWYSEGFAEFASTMTLDREQATLGVAAQHRAWGLFEGERFGAAQMFDPRVWAGLKGPEFDAFYGRGWLLTHYVSFDAWRFGQFRDYVAKLNAGTPSLQAATAAFGDLKGLDSDLSAYLARRRIPGMVTKLSTLPTPEVSVRPLHAGEAALVRLRMTSVRGVDRAGGTALYRTAAPIGSRFPDDAVAQGWLAEMAYDAGDDVAALAAADRALAKDPASVQALLYRARVEMRRLATAGVRDPAAWVAARRTILAANRLDPDDAEPLWLFWESFGQEGRTPVASALKGLYRAQELVPQDPSVRIAAVMSRLVAGEKAQARVLLRPLAYNPHGPADNPAIRMLAALDAGKSAPEVLKAGGAVEGPTD